MNPPIATTLALIEQSLRPLAEALAHIKSYNGPVVYIRDRHHPDLAGVIASYPARVSAKRLEFVRRNIEHRSVDLHASTLGETFATKLSEIKPSCMNRHHIVWGVYVPLPGGHEAVVQLAFDKTIGGAPALGTIETAWETCRDEIITALHSIAIYDTASLIDACKLDVPATPNAFAIKWDIMDSSHVARQSYGELRHFITTFESVIEPIISHYGGHVSSYTGDAQNIIIPIPEAIDRNDTKALSRFATSHITPLIDKIRITHATLANTYSPVMRLRLGVGLGWIETSQLGEETGPILWDIASKMKMRAGSSDIFTLCLDTSVKNILQI